MANTTILKGGNNNQNRINYLTTLLSNAEKHEEYLHSSRDRNFHFILIIFSAIYAIGYKLDLDISTIIQNAFLFIIVLTSFLYELKLHGLSIAWRKTFEQHRISVSKLINAPDEDVEINTFLYSKHKDAYQLKYWLSTRRIVFYVMLIIPILTTILHLT